MTLLEPSDGDGALHASIPVPTAPRYEVAATRTHNDTRWHLTWAVTATPKPDQPYLADAPVRGSR